MRDEFTFTSYKNTRDVHGKPETKTRSQWIEFFAKADVRGRPEDSDNAEALDKNKDGPALVLGVMHDNSKRTNDNVAGIDALALDLDEITADEVLRIAELLKPFEFVIYSTYRNAARCLGGKLKFRIVLFLARRLNPEEYAIAVERLHAMIGGVADAKTKNIARLFFAPATYDPSEFMFDHNSGRLLDLSDLPPIPSAPAETLDDVSPSADTAPEHQRPRSELEVARAQYRAEHPIVYPPGGTGTCPICGHHKCFGALGDTPDRWACFSASCDGAGCEGQGCRHGDVVDIHAHAAGLSPREYLAQQGYLRPEVVHYPGDGHETVAAVMPTLKHQPLLYQRAGRLVTISAASTRDGGIQRDVEFPSIALIKPGRFWEILSASIRWMTPATEEKESMPREPPPQVAKALFERSDWPSVPVLRGLANGPILRPDGTIHNAAGYDSETGLYNVGLASLGIPEHLTREDAVQAARELLEVVCDFPFVSDHHRSAWLAALLSFVAWPAYADTTPLFMFDAPTPGSGKSLQVDAISLIATGLPMTRSAYVESDEEMRKRITAHALAGDCGVLIDNVPNGRTIDLPSLDNALTAMWWTDRILGKSEQARLPLTIVWFATGNNLGVSADSGRRVLKIRIEALQERPQERTEFVHSPLQPWVKENRPRLLARALTMVAAYIRAGCPKQPGVPLGSFERWYSIIRGAIVWAGLADPMECLAVRDANSDPERDAHVRLLQALLLADPHGKGLTALEVIERPMPALREAIKELCPTRDGGLPAPRQLGSKLRGLFGRPREIRSENGVERLVLEHAPTMASGGYVRWRVRRAV